MPPINREELSDAHSVSGDKWVWIGIAVAAFAVRLICLDRFSYWLDEVLETFTVRESWPGLWRSLQEQALHAPLDYVLRKLMETIHPSDAVRRSASVLYGAGCVVVFGALLARRAGRAVGVSAALLLLAAPYHVRYSQEVRPYALGLLLLCSSLFFLDSHLGGGRRRDLLLLYLSCLATLYTLYLAGLILALTAAALVLEDTFDRDAARRSRARRFLARSPFFVAALAIGYAPWLTVLWRALQQQLMTTPPEWAVHRVARFVSYFGFGPRDAFPAGYPDLLFAASVVGGVILACRAPGLRFLIVWGILGIAVLELMEHRHPTYDSIFHWLPAGLGLTALVSVLQGRTLSSHVRGGAKIAPLLLFLALDIRSLAVYFREGRPDWRPLARFLAATPRSQRIFVENQYTQLCLGYYLVGPDWLCCKRPDQREIANLDGDLGRLISAWDRRGVAWLVLAAGPRSPTLRSWSGSFATTSFPTAEGDGGALLRRLEQARPGR